MNCIVCNREQADCLDYGVYERGDWEAMVCTEHQPIAKLTLRGSLEHTMNLRLLKEALNLTWAQIDAPKKP